MLHSLLHSRPLSCCRTLLEKTERSCDSEVKISRAEAAGRDRGDVVSAANCVASPVGDKIHEHSSPSLDSVRVLMNYVTHWWRPETNFVPLWRSWVQERAAV